MDDTLIDKAAKTAREHIARFCFSVPLLSLLAYLGLTPDSLSKKMLSYIINPQNYKELLYVCATITLAPIFWDIFYTPYFGKRARAVKRGAVLIYGYQTRLTFAEVAEKWTRTENSLGYTKDGVLNWLISDMWMGAFEKKDGSTSLFFNDNDIRHINPSREYLICSSFSFLDQDKQDRSNPQNIPLPLDDSMTNNEKKKQLSLMDWRYLASLEVADFMRRSKGKTMYAEGNEMYFGGYIGKLTVPREEFIRWLKKYTHPLPEKWYAKV